MWDLPGGGLDWGEKPHKCLAREIKEESGFEAVSIADRPAYFLTSPHRNGENWVANVLYETKVKDLKFTPSDECLEIRFFTKEEASKENLIGNAAEFVKIYNLENHK